MGIIFAIAFIPMLIAAGVAIDLGRAYLVKTRLAHALDAAGLAVGSSDPASNLNAVLQNYFAANFPPDELGTPENLSMSIGGTTNPVYSLSATAKVETTFLKLILMDFIEVRAASKVLRVSSGGACILALNPTEPGAL